MIAGGSHGGNDFSLGTTYTQDFDALASSGTASLSIEGWVLVESGSNANTTYTAGTGSSNAGDTYSFGSASSSERALGALQSGSLTPSFGVFFVNVTGSTITSLEVSYAGEQWRLGATNRVDRLAFQYSLDATHLSSGVWSDWNPLDFTAPVTTGTVGALNGNVSFTGLSSTITGLSIAAGAIFAIRWTDFNASGADDGLAVDNFLLTAHGAGGDAIAPTLASTAPADDASGVAIGSDIVLTFSENVQKGAGDIVIKLVSDDSVVQTIDVATAAVTVTGTTVTVNPPVDLAPNTAFYVEITPGAIEDLAGNNFGGVAGPETFNFATANANVIGGITILDDAASLQGEASTPQATHAIELVRLGSFAATGGNAEVVSFDPTTDQLYILNTNGAKIEIVQIGSTGALTKTGEINLATLTEFGGANSVAVKNGVVAVAYGNAVAGDNGHVALFNAAGVLQNTIEVGVLPDMLTFTPDGTKILVANEAEARSARQATRTARSASSMFRAAPLRPPSRRRSALPASMETRRPSTTISDSR